MDKPRRPLPSWVALVVVLATAFATGWGMLKTVRGRGWTASTDTPSYLPLDATREVSPSMVALETAGVAVAGSPGGPTIGTAPPIIAGSSPRHEDRGTCTGCHQVVDGNGVAVPAISALAAMPHEFRGMCSNCHTVVANGAGLITPPLPAVTPGQQVAWPTCPGGPQAIAPNQQLPGAQPPPIQQF